MPMLPARHYESDFTRFLQELKARQPHLEEQQREARSIWWDKDPKALADGRGMAEGKVPAKPYAYQPDNG